MTTSETIIAKTIEALGLEKQTISNELPGTLKFWGEEEQTREVLYGKYHREYDLDEHDGIITLCCYPMRVRVDATTGRLVGKVRYVAGEKAEAKRCLSALMSAAGASDEEIAATIKDNNNFEINKF